MEKNFHMGRKHFFFFAFNLIIQVITFFFKKRKINSTKAHLTDFMPLMPPPPITSVPHNYPNIFSTSLLRRILYFWSFLSILFSVMSLTLFYSLAIPNIELKCSWTYIRFCHYHPQAKCMSSHLLKIASSVTHTQFHKASQVFQCVSSSKNSISSVFLPSFPKRIAQTHVDFPKWLLPCFLPSYF